MRWSYHVEKVKVSGMWTKNLDRMTDENLSRFGKDGWELVAVVPMPSGGADGGARGVGIEGQLVYYYFKKPV